MTPVEAAARAIYDDVHTDEPDTVPWEHLQQRRRDGYLRLARLAITAYLEGASWTPTSS